MTRYFEYAVGFCMLGRQLIYICVRHYMTVYNCVIVRIQSHERE